MYVPHLSNEKFGFTPNHLSYEINTILNLHFSIINYYNISIYIARENITAAAFFGDNFDEDLSD